MAFTPASRIRVSAFRRRLARRSPVLWVAAVAVALLGHHPPGTESQTLSQNQRGFGQVATSAGTIHNGDYYALVIGIDDYPAPMHELKTAVNDARAVGQLLQDRYGFKVEYLLNEDATRYKILSALGRYRASLRQDDNLLIYYGGHGYFDHDTDKAYWLPVDADSGTSPNTIMADDLTSVLRALPSRHVLVVSDSCYSGGLSRDADEPTRTRGDVALLQKELGSRSRTLMASGGLEPVTDAGGTGHSVFASAFLRGLQQAEDPEFTAIDLFYTSIRRQVAGGSSQLPEYSTLRNSLDDTGDFVFARKSAPALVATTPPLSHPLTNPVSAAAASVKLSVKDAFDEGNKLYFADKYTEAYPLLSHACDGGSASACSDLGFMFTTGSGVGKDAAQAFGRYGRACDLGDVLGCVGLGVLYRDGTGVGKDDVHAVTLFRRGCDQGIMPGCADLGFMYHRGQGVAVDDTQAVSFYRKACDGGDAYGCTSLGFMYHQGKGVAVDDTQAVSFYRKGCDGGDANGCSNLGLMYENGNGIAKDDAKAISLYRKGCDGGTAHACTDLGFMYGTGKGLAEDDAQAVRLYHKACDGGDAPGCMGLGFMFANGKGVAADAQQAVSLYRKACDDGYAPGCTNLGAMYEMGNGVGKDATEAVSLYRKACDGGNAPGCRNLKRLAP